MIIDHETIAERITEDDARRYALAVALQLDADTVVTRAKLKSAIKRALDEASAATVLDQCHRALRAVDASDSLDIHPYGHPPVFRILLTTSNRDAVSSAITALETFARERGIKLSEFRP